MSTKIEKSSYKIVRNENRKKYIHESEVKVLRISNQFIPQKYKNDVRKEINKIKLQKDLIKVK